MLRVAVLAVLLSLQLAAVSARAQSDLPTLDETMSFIGRNAGFNVFAMPGRGNTCVVGLSQGVWEGGPVRQGLWPSLQKAGLKGGRGDFLIDLRTVAPFRQKYLEDIAYWVVYDADTYTPVSLFDKEQADKAQAWTNALNHARHLCGNNKKFF